MEVKTETPCPASDLIGLAERCEAAAGPDRRLDGLAWRALEPNHEYVEFGEASQVLYRRDAEDRVAFEAPPAFTASLDAAMTLVPKGWRIIRIEQPRSDQPVVAVMVSALPAYLAEGRSMDMTRAIVAAALRARASFAPIETEGGDAKQGSVAKP